ncbi:MAG: PelD GGDEF domain-containing protein [Gammaproteobacteria bacterium]
MFLASKGNTASRWTETAILTFAVPAIGYYIDNSDPFFLHAPFPWLIFPPLLASVRYGFRYGMASIFAITSVLGIGWHLGWPLVPTFPTPLVAGLLIVTTIAAEFYEHREQRERQLQIKCDYLNDRMNEFARIYYILKGSHAQLEQKIAGQTNSLRTSLLQLEHQILTLERGSGDPLEGIAGPILEFFCKQTSTHTAAIYSINSKDQLVLPAIASYGNPPNVWPSNMLLREVIRTKHVASIKPDYGDAVEGVLAVVPLVDIDNHIWAVIMINEMPLFAFHRQTLDLLAVLGGRIGDLVSRRSKLHSFADKPQAFEQSLRRAHQEVQRYHMPAAIVSAIIPASSVCDEIVKQFLADSRGSDQIWIFRNNNDQKVVIKLLSLADSKEPNSFLQRTTGCSLPPSGTLILSKNGVIIKGWRLNPDVSPMKLLRDIYEQCHISAEPLPPASGFPPAHVMTDGD